MVEDIGETARQLPGAEERSPVDAPHQFREVVVVEHGQPDSRWADLLAAVVEGKR